MALGVVVAGGSDAALSVGTLLAIGVAVIVVYRRRSSIAGGAVAIVIFAMVLVLAVGSMPRDRPIYNVNPTLSVELLYVAGFAALICGLIASGRLIPSGAPNSSSLDSRRPQSSRDQKDPSTFSAYLFIGCAAICLAVLNYATGVVPILSGDINAARLNSIDYGVFGRFWPLILPVLQTNIILAGILLIEGAVPRKFLVLASASLLILMLNGGRSLFLFPLVAVALYWVEVRRPRLPWVIGGLSAGAVLLGAIGYLRDTTSGVVTNGSVLDSLDRSLQTGPRVLTLLISQENTNGQFIAGDLLNFLSSNHERSDRLVTVAIGRDPLVVGGSPPTIWGGLYLDFGIAGVLVGAFLLGLLLAGARRSLHERGTAASAVWFSFFCAYILLGAYSYVSIRPSWITVAILCCVLLRGRGLHENSHGLEVRRVSGRSRAASG
ncbi:oligosaccharide repeat unit polymerase [Nocardioides sp. LMS-CY]|uniref:O-antigen polymerase n=1 Tax=Nocardioides sp. (strain LMS-CY) TaxID=2840457 RepID=UPI001BFFF75D|nr:O-antigen polymerase [Nocardioides sp. LMS-CY]QWF21708.1 oligosaccharide repeat unit polymerase [Nocardioides sp. LMS-CY]